jgi:hypothetical protein
MAHQETDQGPDQRPVHQSDEDRFRVIRSEEMEWKPFASFPPAARLAILVGDPGKPGPYLIRVRLHSGHGLSSFHGTAVNGARRGGARSSKAWVERMPGPTSKVPVS